MAARNVLLALAVVLVSRAALADPHKEHAKKHPNTLTLKAPFHLDAVQPDLIEARSVGKRSAEHHKKDHAKNPSSYSLKASSLENLTNRLGYKDQPNNKPSTLTAHLDGERLAFKNHGVGKRSAEHHKHSHKQPNNKVQPQLTRRSADPKHSHKLSLDVQPHGGIKPHVITKRFFGLHIHKKPKVYLVNQVPPQVVYIKKHHRHYNHRQPVVIHPALSVVKLGHHHRHHHHHGVSVHFGLGR